MIPLTIPNYDDNVLAVSPGKDSILPQTFDLVWYQHFDANKRAVQQLQNPSPVAQADLARLAAKLGTKQTGMRIWISAPFVHFLRWSGTGWDFAPGDGSGYYVDGFADPPAPDGWHAADGSDVTYLKADGSIGTRTLSNTANRWFRR
jgi:hypothetical protein